MWRFFMGRERQSVAGSTGAPGAIPVPSAPAQTATGLGARLRGAVSTLVVLALLAGVALWGHFNEWTMPKFSTLLGETAEAESSWCPTHNVPEAECIECNPLLLDEQPNYGWCAEHGIVQCVLEHPDVAQLKETPVIDSEDLERARRALALRSRSENNSRCPAYQRRIQFASLEAIEKAGVDITVVVRRPTVEAIVANGELIYDQTHSAHLASRVPGNVWRVERQVGDAVKNGDVLALIDAAEIGRAKSEFLQSIAQLRLRVANYKRLSSLAGDGTVAVRAVREEEASMQEAEIRLLGAQQTLVNLGLPVDAAEFEDLRTDEISRRIQFLGVQYDLAEVLDPAQTTSNLFPLRSPLDGVVVSRHIVPGEVVDTSTTLFEVTDLRKLWLMLDVRQEDARFVALGQPVFFRPSDSRDAVDIEGRVSWISTSADDQTRTVNVRVDLPNADGKLRANTFGTGRIVLRDEPNAIVVPSEAVQSDGDCTFVFVRDKNFLREGSPKFFHVRQVRTGVSAGGNTEIIAGVLPGEVLAGKNSALLTAQLLKSNLGAGCGCVEGAH